MKFATVLIPLFALATAVRADYKVSVYIFSFYSWPLPDAPPIVVLVPQL